MGDSIGVPAREGIQPGHAEQTREENSRQERCQARASAGLSACLVSA